VQNANSLTMVVNDTGTATVADLNRKVDLNGGDLSDTVVNTFTDATAEYPVPAAGDTMKVIGGKIVKFCADIVKAFTGASAGAAGKKGLVPAPAAGRNTYYLRGDGTWQAPVNDNTTTAAGRVMDARQANPNISGTIAANVKSLNDSITVSYVGNIESAVSGATPSISTIVRVGKTVNFGLRFTNLNYSSSGLTSVGKITSEFRPLGNRFCMGYITINSIRYPAMFLIDLTGTILYDSFSSGTVTQLEVCGSYMIGD
jgi:hypothetical protein